MEVKATQPIIRSSTVQFNKWLADNSGGWAVISAYLQDELEDTYKKLANLQTTPVETEQHRGKAAFISKLLGLNKKPVPFNNDPLNHGA